MTKNTELGGQMYKYTCILLEFKMLILS